MFLTKRLTKEELAERPLDKKGRKHAKALLKGVRKFLRYNDDLISDQKRAEIEEKKRAFEASLATPETKRKAVEERAEELTETCKKSVKDYRPSAWKENIEVIFVAVVIAMGIRAYFIQQFKIPTGSMQPTLNGIIAYPSEEMNPNAEYNAPEGYQPPGPVQRLWDKFWYGRSHVKWVIDQDDMLLFDNNHFYERTHFIFFPRTYLVTRNGEKFSAPGTESRVAGLITRPGGRYPDHPSMSETDKLRIRGSIPVQAGQTIAEGFVDTGDQLVVNKFIYHWRKPRRGEVFVFNTRDIAGIQREIDPRLGSQHYIKRIAGLPGDEVKIEPPRLLVNGEVAVEPGIQRVISMEGRYTGYTSHGQSGRQLGEHEYLALGDNSANSSDSRMWGPVPERNIVGRAALVYYPFGHHFGKVD